MAIISNEMKDYAKSTNTQLTKYLPTYQSVYKSKLNPDKPNQLPESAYHGHWSFSAPSISNPQR
jgi:hypothetical protein